MRSILSHVGMFLYRQLLRLLLNATLAQVFHFVDLGSFVCFGQVGENQTLRTIKVAYLGGLLLYYGMQRLDLVPQTCF